jgi:hypothetical protein
MNENMLFVRSRYSRLLLSLSFERKGKTCAFYANLIRVAPEFYDTDGLACLYHGTFGQNAYSQKR